jgi:hypothetical protein
LLVVIFSDIGFFFTIKEEHEYLGSYVYFEEILHFLKWGKANRLAHALAPLKENASAL